MHPFRTTRPVRAVTRAGVRTLAIMLGLAFTAACSDDAPSAPRTGTDESLGALVASNDTTIRNATGQVQPSAPRDTGLTVPTGEYGLPASLALTESQRAQITALRTEYSKAIAADSAAWLSIFERARAARAAGATQAQIDAILAEGDPLRAKMEQARLTMQAGIDAVFTPAQREWLAKCRGPRQLTAAQQAQVRSVQQAFDQSTASDRAAIEAALREIQSLRAGAGAPSAAIEAQIKSILERVQPHRTRLAAAQQELTKQIYAAMGMAECAV